MQKNAPYSSKSRPKIMGILNVTPDSFSDGGKFADLKSALEHAREMLSEGADIIDVGAESTRPSALRVSQTDEIGRLLPIISKLRKAFPNSEISVDTYKPRVAELAVEAGANIINDVVSDCSDSFPMAKVAAAKNCRIVITHNCRNSENSGKFLPALLENISLKIETALALGVSKENIIIDPGVGFGKTPEENFEIVSRLGELRTFECDILLGVSRKSMFSNICGDDFADRDDATAAISAISTFQNAADILRVHNVRENLNAVNTAFKIRNLWTK